jgi:hypothetical protein
MTEGIPPRAELLRTRDFIGRPGGGVVVEVDHAHDKSVATKPRQCHTGFTWRRVRACAGTRARRAARRCGLRAHSR